MLENKVWLKAHALDCKKERIFLGEYNKFYAKKKLCSNSFENYRQNIKRERKWEIFSFFSFNKILGNIFSC